MVHRLLPFLTLLATAVLLGPSPLWSHGGGLDKLGYTLAHFVHLSAAKDSPLSGHDGAPNAN